MQRSCEGLGNEAELVGSVEMASWMGGEMSCRRPMKWEGHVVSQALDSYHIL